MDTPPTTAAFDQPTREALAPLLLRRFQLLVPLVLLGTGAFATLHVVFGEPHLFLLLSLKGAQAVLIVAGLWFALRRPTRRTIVFQLVALTVVLNAVTAITGIVIGNIHTNTMLFVATALASSSFLPWGPVAQSLSVGGAALASLAPLLAGDGAYFGIWYDLSGSAVAFAISIYIAREVENETLAGYRAQAATAALAESRADFEGLFRSSNVLLALFELTEDDFVYAEVNETLATLFGRTVESMRGMTGREVGFSEDEILQWRATIQRCTEEGSLHVPEYCLKLIQPERWYHLGYSAVRNRPGRVSGVGIDITELREAREALQGLNLELEAQVRERTALLEAANKDLESFAYSVSHDLRTPLRTIEGFAALLEDDHASELSPEARTQLDRIRTASHHMAQLINDMLMLSRASRTEMRREPIDVTLLARSLVAEMRSAHPDRDVRVTIEPGLFANADPQLLRVVLVNLLGNAWKYTGGRDVAQIHVGTEIYEDELVFFVRDNGCGFDMRFVGKLFQPFQRLHAADEFEGTGVGLATVARIVRRHGGKVWAEGKVDHGATFRFTVGATGIVNAS